MVDPASFLVNRTAQEITRAKWAQSTAARGGRGRFPHRRPERVGADPPRGSHDNPRLTLTARGCHNGGMSKHAETAEHQEMSARMKEVGGAAIGAARRTAELARERRRIMEALLAD